MRKITEKKILELVKNNYDSIASDFSQTRKRLLWPELVEAAKKVKTGESLLDAACGSGRLLDEFKGLDFEYLGFDNSSELIDCAKKNYPDRDFIVDDLLELKKVKNNNFDWVFCIAALHHLPSDNLRVQVLENLGDKLKKDGKLVLSVWRPAKNKKFLRARRINFWRKVFFLSDLDFGDAIFEWGGEISKSENRFRYYHSFKDCELKKIIKKSGLKTIDFKKDEYNYFMVLMK
ncbi:MAG: class I SAM-dependent methyltransferase [Patescibacteria group bacterium]